MADLTSSDISSDSSDLEVEHTMDDGAADRLEVQLRNDPYSVELHTQYISALRQIGDFQRLQAARQAAESAVPLHSQFWIDWLDDLEGTAVSAQEKEAVANLYERALLEHPFVDVWLKYLQFAKRRFLGEVPFDTADENYPTNLSTVRELFDRAVELIGYHGGRGSDLWKAYRAFEQDVLDTLAESTTTTSEQLQAQVDNIRQLYRTEMAVPLIDLDAEFDAYETWEKVRGGVKKDIQNVYNKTRDMLVKEGRQLLEERLRDAGEFITPVSSRSKAEQRVLSAAMQELVLLEQQTYLETKKPGKKLLTRVRAVYNRALICFPAAIDYWHQYSQILESLSHPDAQDLAALYRRATKNFRWDSTLWINYMLAVERTEADKQAIEHVYQQAVSCPFAANHDYLNVFLSFASYLIRQYRTNDNDVNVKAQFEQLMEQASQFLSDHTSNDYADLIIFWSSIESQLFEDASRAKEMLTAATKTNALSKLWLHFIEFEHSRSTAPYANIRRLYLQCIKNISDDGAERFFDHWLRFERVYGSADHIAACVTRVIAQRQQLYALAVQAQQQQQQKRKKPDRNTTSQPSRKRTHEEEEPHEEKKLISDKQTVFVVGLPLTVDQDQLQKIFSEAGNILGVRVVKFPDGRSKGFAYIDFESENGASDAVSKFHNTKLENRTIQVTISKPPSSRARVEELTVFVSHLNTYATTEKALRNHFQQCGAITDIRLIKERSGKLKGIAYIDFETEEGVENAIKLSNTRMSSESDTFATSSVIKVARSLPQKKEKDQHHTSQSQQQQQQQQQPAAMQVESKFKQTSLVPRTMRKSVLAAAKVTTQNQTKEETSTESADVKKQKTNSDFRKQLGL